VFLLLVAVLALLHLMVWLWEDVKVLRKVMLSAAVVVLSGGFAAVVAASDTGSGAHSLSALMAKFKRDDTVQAPPDNPQSAEKIELGKALFFDPRMSGSGVISCASCHNPSLGWQDGMAKGRGHMGVELGRHTPTILNTAWSEPLFWDGRAATLEEQAKGPIQAEKEMNGSVDAVKAIAAIEGYQWKFQKVFPGEGITIDTIAKAIASYERTIISKDAPFDKWINGDEAAISDEAKLGFIVFNGKAKCATCHAGWRFTDDGFHDIGINDDDQGRGKIMPGADFLNHAFKTPTLRSIAQRAPYMHDGSIGTLEAVIDHYDHGFVQRSSLSAEMTPLNLTSSEKQQLVAFLKTLSSQDDPVTAPILPR
jgi:cytochrome c peroxidase